MSAPRAREMGFAFLSLLLLAALGCAEKPTRVTTCQLHNDPKSYDRKLVEVTSLVSHGFEDFTLFDAACPSYPPVWLEYGGTVSSGTIYCCEVSSARERPGQLFVEDIPIPLVEDEHFREFDRLIQQKPDTVVRATVVGRFFSGLNERFPQWSMSTAYGHMRCCSLLAIQQVVSVDPQNQPHLDYRAHPDHPDFDRSDCQSQYLHPIERIAELIDEQRQAEGADRVWAFADPKRVASEALAQILEVDAATVIALEAKQQSPGRIVFEWTPDGKRVRYVIVASRPFWLYFHAKDPQRIAWVIIAIYSISCG